MKIILSTISTLALTLAMIGCSAEDDSSTDTGSNGTSTSSQASGAKLNTFLGKPIAIPEASTVVFDAPLFLKGWQAEYRLALGPTTHNMSPFNIDKNDGRLYNGYDNFVEFEKGNIIEYLSSNIRRQWSITSNSAGGCYTGNMTEEFDKSYIGESGIQIKEFFFTLCPAEDKTTLSSSSSSSSQSTSSAVADFDADAVKSLAPLQYNGLTYIPVISAYTGVAWLDRNVGATKACSTPRSIYSSDAQYIANEKACFGNYYQWGRNSDGHELQDSPTSTQQLDTLIGNNQFILSSNNKEDWTTSDKDGSARVQTWIACPDGYQIATTEQIKAETIDLGIQKQSDSEQSFLKLAQAGYRDAKTGEMKFQGNYTRLFLNDTNPTKQFSSDLGKVFVVSTSSAQITFTNPASGAPIRCIENPETFSTYWNK